MPRNDTSKVFRRKEPDARHLTSHRIAEDLDAFRSAGGEIEVLGVTRVLTRLDPVEVAADTARIAPARPGSGSRRSGSR